VGELSTEEASIALEIKGEIQKRIAGLAVEDVEGK
jgi:hypothetical protein